MEKPNKKDYGYDESTSFDNEPAGWCIEGGEEEYEKAMELWEFMEDNKLGDEDMVNDNH